MSPFDRFLSAHKWSKRTGNGRGLFRCEAHEDKTASGTATEKEDGRILIHCHAGCSAADIVGAVGLTLSDLFPPRPIGVDFKPPERRPVHAEDALKAVAHEVLVAAIIVNDIVRLHKDAGFTDEDLATILSVDEPTAKRLMLCAERMARASDLATGKTFVVSQEAQRIIEDSKLRPQEEKELEEFLS
jgi:hypothetical protein